MSLVTPEQKARYQANRRRKYAEDEAHREQIKRNHLKWRQRNWKAYNEALKLRRKNDPVWREKQNSRLRGRDQRHQQLKTLYGISKTEYEAMLSSQGGVCAVCKRPSEKTLHVDHCHSDGHVRGLLCQACNIGLGCFRDDPSRLLMAAKYLEDQDAPRYIF